MDELGVGRRAGEESAHLLQTSEFFAGPGDELPE
jgi:hypothetical protein